ncbi:MAG: DUF5050 domain-containing protein [Epulopiscium sp.]|nr:DUF5050 domain-containing protein [Candidatus Epulonipiscium sp.]
MKRILMLIILTLGAIWKFTTSPINDTELADTNIIGDYQENLEEEEMVTLSNNDILPNNSTSNITNKGLAIEEGDKIYYSDETNLWSISTDGRDKTLLLEEAYPINIQIIGDEIYYISQETHHIYKVNKDGSENRPISKDKAYSLNIYNGKLYFMDRYNKLYITSMSLDGKNKEVIKEVVANDMMIYEGYIYYITKEGELGRVKTDGSEGQIVESHVMKFDVSEQGLYYTYDPSQEEKPQGLFCLDFTDLTSTQILTETPYSFNVHQGLIYYNHPTNYNLYSMSVNGDNKTKIIGSNVTNINIAGGYIYYKNIEDNKKIYRVNKDGTNRQALEGVTTVSNVLDLSREINDLEGKEISPKLRRSYDYSKEIINEIISPDMSEYEKTKIIHDYVVGNTSYDIETAESFLRGEDSDSNSFTAYGVLINNKGVCQGYAEATQILLSLAGIESDLVIGHASNEDGEPVPHMWNVVLVDDKYYMLDTTWDDPVGVDLILYNYFLIDSATLSKTHTWAYDEYPECNNYIGK